MRCSFYRTIYFNSLMLLQILKSKIQEIIVTESSIDYPGSISLPSELFAASGIKPFELVHVNNKTNGSRIITYAVKNSEKGRVTVNGAASHLFRKGDVIHVLSFVLLDESEVAAHRPILVITDKDNNVIEKKPYLFDEL